MSSTRKTVVSSNRTYLIQAMYDCQSVAKDENGVWWWADEIWGWHGPFDTKQEAVEGQNFYVDTSL